uniref:RHS repeat-associated core domain-containing protein n=1 Tax=Burkholderia cepacia TaxID=292 RepID=UPI001ABB6D4F
GNLSKRWHQGKESRYAWDLFDRLTHYEDERLAVDYTYDALGRRLSKYSKAHYEERREAGPHWNRAERVKRNRDLQCGFTLYGWDGDTLAWESKIADEDGFGARTTHYVYEPGSFVPVAQAVRQDAILLLDQPEYGDYYRQDEDPLWMPPPPAPPIDGLAWYQCDHLGTPQELTDEHSEIVWSAEYRAWGAVKEVVRKASGGRVEVRNPIRFQGQYHDHETGLHYNRYRYYDYDTGRYLSPDPLGLGGGINVYAYAGGNPVAYYDPLGLKKFGKNHPHCVAIREKVTGLQNELNTRWSELVGGLPERIGPGERLAETMRGHRTMINQKDSILRRWEKKYDEDCDDNDLDDGSSTYSACPSGSTVVKTAAGVGAAYASYRAIRMIPSLVPPLWWTIPANAITP